MCQLNVSREGKKTRLTWEKTDPEDVEKARTFFTKLTRQGWLAVPVSRRTGEVKRILEFKPEYGELCFMPLSEGG